LRAASRLLAFILAVALLAYGLLSRSDTRWLACVYASTLPIGYILFSLVPRQTIGWRRNAWKVFAVLVVGYIALSMQLLREQFIVAPTLASEPFGSGADRVVNPRVARAELRIQRGRVFDREGRELAGRVVNQRGFVRRTYPVPEASYLVGYNSPALYGKNALESRYDDYLSGRRGAALNVTRDSLLRRPAVGNDLILTLDAELQRLGHRLLGDRRGAVVALEPRTGAVLALVSNPSYNAAELVADPTKDERAERQRIRATWERWQADTEGQPFLNRATRGLYSPGSTFKTVTGAAALAEEAAFPEKVYEDDGVLVVEGAPIRDPNRPDKRRVRWTFTEAYQWSLNAVFAQVGLDLKSAGLREYGRRFYFDRDIPFDLRVAQSSLEREPGFLSDDLALAVTSFGQGQLLSTPLHVALQTATIANGGVMPRPYLVAEARSPQGQSVFRQEAQRLESVVPPEAARQMTQIMTLAVQQGTGKRARIPGVQVAGKTGTAQLRGSPPHAWFTSFAPASDPKVAVAVLVENGGEGAVVAAPIAREMMEAALRLGGGE
jgi:peptidoglycan glycosyltransferase